MSIKDGRVIAHGEMSATRLSLSESVNEGGNCEAAGATGVGLTFDKSLAVCVDGRWVVSARLGLAGSACNTPGKTAIDSNDGQALLCRGNRYVRSAAYVSNFVLVDTLAVQFSGSPIVVNKPTCATSGTVTTTSLIILSPNNEDVAISAPANMSGINRFAIDNGDYWTVMLERSADHSILPGNMVASIYCHYS